MITHLSGYSHETIMAGHNNTATVFSEGLIAGGLVGLFGFAVLAGLIIQALYRFIDNRLRANDFIAASIGASYMIMGLMAWLIGGGITAIVHLSIFVAFVWTFILLRLISGRLRRSPSGKLNQGRPIDRATIVG
jgi:membrane protein implicated in regulation of membrane protease activity